MLCPKCGKEVHQDDVICLNCGNLLTSTYRPVEQVQPIMNDQPVNPVPVATNINDGLKFDVGNEQVVNQSPIIEPNIMGDVVTPEQMAAMEMNQSYNEITTEQVINNGYVSPNSNSFTQDNMSNLVYDIENSSPIEPISEIPVTPVQPVAPVVQPVVNPVSMQVPIQNVEQPVEVVPTVIPPVEPAIVNPVPTVVPNQAPIVEPQQQNVSPKKVKPKKEKQPKNPKNKGGLFIIIGVILSILAVSLGVYYYISKKAPAEYVISTDKFPSITAVVGSRKLTDSSTTNEDDVVIKKYHYTKIKSVMTDLYQYMNYLTQSLNFVNTSAYDLNEETGTIQLGNESVTNGYVISVVIEYNIDEYTITVKKVPGTLTRY